MRRSLALVRCHLASSGAAASRRALPVYGGLFAGAGMLFGGNGLEATTVVAGAQAPVVRALLWVAWLSVTMPTIDALWRTPASFWLRSLPVPRWWHLGVLGVLTIAAESPWWWLWSAGGGVMVGLAALGGALAGHAMVLARPPGAIGVGWVVGTVAVLVVVPVEYLAFGTWPIALVAFRRAWLAAPGRAGGRPRAVIGGPRVIALASALLVSLVRGHAAILLRSGLLFGLAAGAAWLAARSNGHVTGEARLYDACGFVAPVALAAGSAAAGPMLVTAARASWLLRTGGASARTALAAGTLAAGVVGGGLGLVTGGVLGWIWGMSGTQWPAMSGTLALAGGALAVLASLAARMAARQGTRGPGRLVGACLSDQQSDGLSMIYSFYDPMLSGRKGLGTFIILDHILRASRAGLPYVYLGYWVEGSERMAYKAKFRPIEKLGREGWNRFEPGPVASVGKVRTPGLLKV